MSCCSAQDLPSQELEVLEVRVELTPFSVVVAAAAAVAVAWRLVA